MRTACFNGHLYGRGVSAKGGVQQWGVCQEEVCAFRECVSKGLCVQGGSVYVSRGCLYPGVCVCVQGYVCVKDESDIHSFSNMQRAFIVCVTEKL